MSKWGQNSRFEENLTCVPRVQSSNRWVGLVLRRGYRLPHCRDRPLKLEKVMAAVGHAQQPIVVKMVEKLLSE